MVVRIMMLITGTFLLTYTTSPIALTDGLEMLLGPSEEDKRARARDEHDDEHGAALHPHAHRGDGQDNVRAEGPRRGLRDRQAHADRAKALLPLLVPLFVSSFRRADELAVAMESRCYHGGEGRTRMKQLHDAPPRLARRCCSARWCSPATIVMNVYGL